MANHKSAKKRARQNIVRNTRNRSARSTVRTAIKKFRTAIEEGTAKEALEPLFKSAQTLMSMAASKGLYHKNTASRTIGRLAVALNKQSDVKAAEPTKKKATKKKSAAKKKATKKTTASKKKTSKKK